MKPYVCMLASKKQDIIYLQKRKAPTFEMQEFLCVLKKSSGECFFLLSLSHDKCNRVYTIVSLGYLVAPYMQILLVSLVSAQN